MNIFLLRATARIHGCRIRLKKFSVTPQGVVAVRHINCSSCTLMAALLDARFVGANGYPLAGLATAAGTRVARGITSEVYMRVPSKS